MPELYVCSGVIPCSLSDHDIIYTVFKHPKTQTRVISILDFKTFDIMEYNKDLTCLMDLFKIVYIIFLAARSPGIKGFLVIIWIIGLCYVLRANAGATPGATRHKTLRCGAKIELRKSDMASSHPSL